MASSPQGQEAIAGVGGLLRWLWRLLASLKLAVILIVALAVVLAWTTFLESARGREYAQWSIYGRSWFVALWGLLGVNILAAVLCRFPWKKRQIGFLITHAGLLVLLGGALLTLAGGIEGRLAFLEGETADSILIPDRSQLTVYRQGQHGQQSTNFAFSGGPVDWPAGKTLDLGTSEGLAVKVLKFYCRGQRTADWVADDSGGGGPALRFALSGPGAEPVMQGWLPTDQFSTTMRVGPARLQLEQASADAMLEDFRRPPTDHPPEGAPAGKDGVLSMHYDGKMYRVAVAEKVGQRVPVGQSGILVEIVKYLPNALAGPKVQFTSEGDEPKRPLLDLLVHLPGEDKPLRQLAFAQDPFLTLDGVHGRPCPVRFWYHHPAVPAPPGAELLQTSDGKLYCRLGVEGAYQWRGEVQQGDQIEVAAQYKLSILKYIPRARQEVSFQPVELPAEENAGPEAAALVELTAAGGKPQEVWLQRGDEMHGFQRLQTPQGAVVLTFGYEYLPLHFSLKLLDFQRGMNPGRMGDASFSSSVQLMDPAAKIDEPREISMNKPLSYGKFTFYQSSFQELPDGRQASILSVAYDPGRILKYLGCLMICVGTFVMFYLRRPLAGKAAFSASQSRSADTDRPQSDGNTSACPWRDASATPTADPDRSTGTNQRSVGPTGTGYARVG